MPDNVKAIVLRWATGILISVLTVMVGYMVTNDRLSRERDIRIDTDARNRDMRLSEKIVESRETVIKKLDKMSAQQADSRTEWKVRLKAIEVKI